jgi:transcriptional regulator with XRE-family HTH domain
MGKHVGTYIRQMREKRGLSQGDVAKLLSLKTAQSISNIERGVSPLPRTKIKRLADVLGVRKNEIVTIVLKEVRDRYSKAAGLTGSAVVITSGLAPDEFSLIDTLAEKLREARAGEKAQIKKQMKRILGRA